MDLFNLKGKVAIVTGSGRGIGRATVLKLRAGAPMGRFMPYATAGLAIGDAYAAGLEFQDRDWIRQHQNLLIHGATGSGKTFLACALAHQACDDR